MKKIIEAIKKKHILQILFYVLLIVTWIFIALTFFMFYVKENAQMKINSQGKATKHCHQLHL